MKGLTMHLSTESMLGNIAVGVRKLPTDWLGTILDLMEKLASATGPSWIIELRKFLRKEPTWVSDAGSPQIQLPLAATLDLATTPRLPFVGAVVDKHVGTGAVTIEKRADGQLYIDGKKVVLHLSERQLGGKWLKGHELRTELDGKLVLNATVLDFLEDHPEFIPDDWKKDEQGNTRFVYFWGTVYRNAAGGLFVRYLCWNDGRWRFDYDWLDFGWDGNNPAACLES